MLIRLTIISFILSSCISDFDQTIEYRIDSRLTKYVDSFHERSGLEKYNLLVIVTPLKELGLSSVNGSQRVITINETAVEIWDSRPILLEFVIYHELGHALLNRGHCGGESIMNDDLKPNYYEFDSLKREQLINELFQWHK